jgi:hypothetical protein
MADTIEYAGILTGAVGKSSRYKNHQVIEVNNVASQETWNPPEIPVTAKDKYHRVSSEKWRLDKLAYYYYGDQHLWWVIAYANGIVDPFMELDDQTSPQFLRIPDPQSVMSRLT